MERDYDYSSRLHFADLDAPEAIGRKAGERAVQPAQPAQGQDRPGRRWSSTRAWRAASPAISPAPSTARRSRARPASCATGWASRSPTAGSPSPTIRCACAASPRAPSTAKASRASRSVMVEEGVLNHWFLSTSAARELGLETNGRGVRAASSVSPSSTNLAHRARREVARGADRVARHRLLRHRSVRPGRQHDHRRIQPRRVAASGSRTANWPIRSSEVTIASNLEGHVPGMIAGQRPRPQFRHRRADAAHRRHDPCRQLTHVRRRRRCRRSGAARRRRAPRPAGSPCGFFKRDPEVWMKGGQSPVSEADYAVDTFLRETLLCGPAGLWLAVGRDRRRSPARLAATAHLRRRSDRRHARLPRRPRRLVRQRSRWSRTARRWPACSNARPGTRPTGRAGRRRLPERRRGCRGRQPAQPFAVAGPKPLIDRDAGDWQPALQPRSLHSVAGLPAGDDRRRRARRDLRQGRTPMTGTSPRPT